MPPIILVLFVLNLLSLAILGASGWLGWSWYQGDLIIDRDGTITRVREDWQLWTALALLGWSFLGRKILVPLLARKDDVATKPKRRAGEQVQGVDRADLYVETLGTATTPTVIFTHGWGLDSTIWNYAKSHARLQIVEGVNHMGFLERADLYNAAIAGFVDQVTGTAAPQSVAAE